MKISGYIGGWRDKNKYRRRYYKFLFTEPERRGRGKKTCYLPSRETRASRMAFETYCCRNEGCRTSPGWRRPAWRTPLCWIDCKLQQTINLLKIFENFFKKIIRTTGGNFEFVWKRKFVRPYGLIKIYH